MVNVFVKTEDGRICCERMADILRRGFALFNEQNSLSANINSNGLSLSYWTAEKQLILEQTEFDIQIRDKVGDVLSLQIEEEYWRQGKGRQLYGCIERFFIERGCAMAVTSPSGMGYDFWPAIGFRPREGNMWEKDLR